MRTAVVALAALLIVGLAGGARAEAGDRKIVVRFGAPVHRPPRVFVVPQGRLFVVPGPVWVVPGPVWVVQPRRCFVPGYWAYAWIPQTYADNVWVDGQYSPDALWIAGHYEPRIYTSGYYQPYWVPERWADCY